MLMAQIIPTLEETRILKQWYIDQLTLEEKSKYCDLCLSDFRPELMEGVHKWADACDRASQHEEQIKKLYKYLLTFTKKPDIENEKVLQSVHNLAGRSHTLGIQKLMFTEEHIDSNYHIHVYLETSKPLAKDRLTSYERFGHIDRQVAKGTLADVECYLGKENDMTILIDVKPLATPVNVGERSSSFSRSSRS